MVTPRNLYTQIVPYPVRIALELGVRTQRLCVCLVAIDIPVQYVHEITRFAFAKNVTIIQANTNKKDWDTSVARYILKTIQVCMLLVYFVRRY